MNSYLPGTVIETDTLDPDSAGRLLDGIFAAGGLVLSQICTLTGFELYTVQNWVRRGFVSPPTAKKYSKRQFCRLVIINMLKDSMLLGDIKAMISYINGNLADESDDTVGDDALYLYFIAMLNLIRGGDSADVKAAAEKATEGYVEIKRESRARICRVLEIMYFAYRSSVYRACAAETLAFCKEDGSLI